VAGIIEGAEKAEAAPGSEQRLIADLYRSYMDTDAIEAAGLGPLKRGWMRLRRSGRSRIWRELWGGCCARIRTR
jgi:predicted metalloendopeptidase